MSIEKSVIARSLSALTGTQRQEADMFFKTADSNECDNFVAEKIQPELQQLHFGGDYHFDDNRKQVELHGEFSKKDLLRIAEKLR